MSKVTKCNTKKIKHTFLTGKLSTTIIIPIEIARRYGINAPSDVVVVEETNSGILVRKIEIE
jgi:hypothetical protein